MNSSSLCTKPEVLIGSNSFAAVHLWMPKEKTLNPTLFHNISSSYSVYYHHIMLSSYATRLHMVCIWQSLAQTNFVPWHFCLEIPLGCFV
jgi:hypothetical protein